MMGPMEHRGIQTSRAQCRLLPQPHPQLSAIPCSGTGWQYLNGLAALFFAAASVTTGADSRVLGTDRDLDGLAAFPPKSIVHWQWTPEQKQQADQFSRMELTRDSTGAMLWTLRVSPAIPFSHPYLAVLNLGVKYFPPEADAIRMKVKVVAGQMLFGFGGPTAYFGNSDVFCQPISLDAATDGSDWRTVEFSFHFGLLRNFRRAGFSEKAPWIYYARWAQEPMLFYIYKGSGGEIQIKDLEVVAQGLGQPFPEFAAADISPQATLVDFQSATATAQVFTALIGDTDKEFDLSWNQPDQVRHPPLRVELATDPEAGTILHSRGRFSEEVTAIGLQFTTSQTGDGLRFRIKVATGSKNLLVPAVPGEPLDFLLYAATDSTNFDWQPFSPSPELHRGPGRGFERNLTFARCKSRSNLSLAIYHSRRFVPNGRWADVVIPLADFLCTYGCGDFSSDFQRQLPPDPRRLVAVLVLAPWPRQDRSETTIDLRDLTLVGFKDSLRNRRSFFQDSDLINRKSLLSPKGRYLYLPAPGTTNFPPALKKVLAEFE